MLIDTKTRKLARKLERDPRSDHPPKQFVFSPDGKLLAGYSEDQGNIRLWTVDTGKRLVRPNGHTAYAWLTEVSPDGKWIATHGWDGTIRFWDSAGGKESGVIQSGSRYGMAFSPDSSRIAATSSQNREGSVSVWDVQSKRWERGFRFHDFSCRDVDWSSNGKWLTISGPEGVCVVDSKDGEDIFFKKMRSVKLDARSGILSEFTFDDRKVVLNRGITVQVLDASTGNIHKSIPIEGGTTGIRVSPDGKHLLATIAVGHIAIYEIDSGKKIRTMNVDEPGYNRFSSRYNRDGSRIATLHCGWESKLLILWDAKNGKILRRVFLPGGAGSTLEPVFSPDNRHILVPRGDGPIYVLRLEEHK